MSIEELIVPVRDPFVLSPGEKEAILGNIESANFSLYRWEKGNPCRQEGKGQASRDPASSSLKAGQSQGNGGLVKNEINPRTDLPDIEKTEALFSTFAAQLGAIQRDDHLCAKNGISRIEPIDPNDDTRTSGGEGGQAYPAPAMAPAGPGAIDPRSRFIPYSRRPIGAHTDGYYQAHPIRSILLHCVYASGGMALNGESLGESVGESFEEEGQACLARTAVPGGENFFIDHEILYYLLHQKNPDWTAALSAPDAFSVPEDDLPEGDPRKSNRPKFTGPVFSFENGHIFMRYSGRPKNIIWRDDALTREALAALKELITQIRTPGDEMARYLISGRLDAGMGVAGRNVVHGRSAFEGERMIMRIRSFDEITSSS